MADHSKPRRDSARGALLDRQFGPTANGTAIRAELAAGVAMILAIVPAVATAIAMSLTMSLTFTIATGIGLGLMAYSPFAMTFAASNECR